MTTNLISLSSLDDKYVKEKSTLNSEPEWLMEIRNNAFSNYSSLPHEVSPLYKKYSDANLLYPDRVFLSPGIKSYIPEDYLNERIRELDKETSMLKIGSSIVHSKISDKLLKQGVVISDLKSAIKDYGSIIKDRMYSNQLSYSEDKFLALELSCFDSGVFVYIPRNVIIDDSIRIINVLAPDGTSSITRNIVVAESNSKATIVQELYSNKQFDDKFQQSLFELLECYVGSNARLEVVTLQAMNETNSVNFSNRKAFIEKDAKMSWYMGLFGGQLSRYKIDNIMKGEGASAEDVEIIFGINDQSFDVTSNLIHNGSNTRGRVLSKSVMKDKSKSLFKGMIKIDKNGKSAESFLAGHAILLDKGAKSDTIPGLEIETNEVRATHSASVAQIDENQIFYLMCRGLSNEEAKREIVSGFLEPLSRKMGPTIRAWVNYLIENKWLGKPLLLKTDEAMEHILEVEKSRYRETEDIFEKHYKYR
ncbi:MAG TPA: SufD family Fe-S cluster assembly protein [Nitrososphaeraceae archaeon]|jgi:FeS assembly protein SufD|nr:SufD family Fe-S cluster assembly protein [Nitrososphaeraceae archaeon]